MNELLERFKKGDEQAFTELMLAVKSDLYRLAKIRLDNDYDIGDAIQETMIKAYKYLKGLKDNSKFKNWIFKVLINECNKIYKKKKNTTTLNLENDFYDKYNTTRISESQINFNELIKNLNYEEKIIITLFYNNLYTSSEIAKILNMNVHTVKSKLNRAKNKIKVYYKGGALYV